MIAEPWSFRGHIGEALRSTGYASWNDGFREFMLSYALGRGNFDGFKYFISGSRGGYASFPAQTVNYLESHDDKCLLDRISPSPETPSEEDLRRYKLAYALVFLSIGIPMAAEGFDLARTKGGLNNTYKTGRPTRWITPARCAIPANVAGCGRWQSSDSPIARAR